MLHSVHRVRPRRTCASRNPGTTPRPRIPVWTPSRCLLPSMPSRLQNTPPVIWRDPFRFIYCLFVVDRVSFLFCCCWISGGACCDIKVVFSDRFEFFFPRWGLRGGLGMIMCLFGTSLVLKIMLRRNTVIIFVVLYCLTVVLFFCLFEEWNFYVWVVIYACCNQSGSKNYL